MADPQQPDAPIHETTTEARAGSSQKTNFHVLGIGLVAVIALFAIILFLGS